MAPSTTMKLNEWARVGIPLISILLAFWGGYTGLKYQVTDNKDTIAVERVERETECKKVWTRFKEDEGDRTEMKDNSANIQRTVDKISTVQTYMVEDIKEIKEAIVK